MTFHQKYKKKNLCKPPDDYSFEMYFAPNKASHRVPVHKAEGNTLSERYLNSLCEKSFLSLWSYPSIFRDQKQRDRGDGKELCDMLVIFGKHILLFSDKYCAFPNTGDDVLDWNRWYRRTIYESAIQAWGAERWLKTYPQRVYVDRACSQPFPLPIPPPERAIYHIILVAHGSEDRCKAFYPGSSGSLIIDSSLGHQDKEDPVLPFSVGDIDPRQTFVHIMTDHTLQILLNALDTATDFIWYLDKKETLMRSKTKILAHGEEDLLAWYMMNINDQGQHDFVFDRKFDGILLDEGRWETFCRRPERLERLKEDRISYIWDSIIERFAHHALSGTQYYSNHAELSNTEIGLRFMASEPRFVRRVLVKNMLSIFVHAPDSKKRVQYHMKISPGGAFYVFLCLPKPEQIPEEQYRIVRGKMLEASCKVLKYQCPEALDIVGFASDPVQPGQGCSEDLLYLKARIWSEEDNAEAAQLQQDFHILTAGVEHSSHEEEYPAAPLVKSSLQHSTKIGRNTPCPCGSGKKYKRCHGR